MDIREIAESFIAQFNFDFGTNNEGLELNPLKGTSKVSIAMFGINIGYIALRGRQKDKKPVLSMTQDRLNKLSLTIDQLPPYEAASDKDQTKFFPLSEDLSHLMKLAYDYSANYPSDYIFGCCSLYEKCSDAKQCIQTDSNYARGCVYRKHLLEGRIFYGANRNVD